MEVEVICPTCLNQGIDLNETDGDGRLTGCYCDCPVGAAMLEQWLTEHPDER